MAQCLKHWDGPALLAHIVTTGRTINNRLAIQHLQHIESQLNIKEPKCLFKATLILQQQAKTDTIRQGRVGLCATLGEESDMVHSPIQPQLVQTQSSHCPAPLFITWL